MGHEIITIEQVAERLHISRATLFIWMQRGIFIRGKHFFKQGRVVRFIWCEELLTALMGESSITKTKPVVQLAPAKKNSHLNWDY